MSLHDDLTALDEATSILHRTSNEGLLRTFAALTHRLHAADRKRDPQAVVLRSQRDHVQVEILRRMVDHE